MKRNSCRQKEITAKLAFLAHRSAICVNANDFENYLPGISVPLNFPTRISEIVGSRRSVSWRAACKATPSCAAPLPY